MTIVDKILEHHGTKGMRWGVRKRRSEAARAAKFGPQAPEHARARELKKKPLSRLSNEELKELNTRTNLEQSYRKMNPSTIKKGENLAKGLLSTVKLAGDLNNLLSSDTGKRLTTKGEKWAPKHLAAAVPAKHLKK